jgi:hypothetical protein
LLLRNQHSFREEGEVMKATDNDMCATCRKITPDKYKNCDSICRALIVFLNLTPEEAEVYKSDRGQTSH